MKKYLLLFIITFVALTGFSQNYGNEWINYNQQYYKIKIEQEAIYRITYNTLIAYGVPVGNIDPRNFQIFHEGEEQYIYVEGELDGVFNTTDFIEFYADKNDGSFDTQLFKSPEDQGNPNHSLFNDTSSYYLTWNNSTVNKRMTPENDVNFSNYTAADYFIKESRVDYTTNYYYGKTNSYQVPDPEYMPTEGWFSNALSMGGTLTKSVSTSNVYTSGPNASVKYVVAGASDYDNLSPDHHLEVSFAGMVKDTFYEGYELCKFHYSLPASSITSSSTSFTFKSISIPASNADRSAVAYISVRYPHTSNLGNVSSMRMIVPNGSGKTRLDLTGLNVTSGDAWLFDISNNRRIKVVNNSGTFQMLVPNSFNEKECFLTSDGETINVGILHPVSKNATNPNKFTDLTTSTILNSDYLIVTHSSLLTSAQAYASYRSSSTGGNYKTVVVDIDDLYEQFAYGIVKHPLAIRNYIRYAYNNFTDTLEYMLLIGKGLSSELGRYDNTNYTNNLVPTLGHPPSDILLSSGIVDTLFMPAVATGRISAKDNNDVTIYLNKIQEYEQAQLQPELWMKRVLHFGGGTSSAEQNLIKAYLKRYKEIIEDTLFGGNVYEFYKTSSDPIQYDLSKTIREYIDNGVSVMTFFGHAAGIGFDVSIDHPSEYENKGKYPFMVALSCFAGDLFGTATSSSEEFVLIEDKGTIGYLASITKAVPSILNLYAEEFYERITYKNYGGTVGKSIQRTIQEIQMNNTYVKEVCLEMTYHGDPALVINHQPKPDYVFDNSKVFFTPTNVTTEVDSFIINVISTNIGLALNDSMIIEVKRTLPDGNTSQTYLTKVLSTHYRDTIEIKMPVNDLTDVGMNTFSIKLDSYNNISEMSESNNNGTVYLNLKSADVIPVYPYEFAIVPNSSLTLKASTSYPFIDAKDYVFEIDTSSAFNSPLKETGQINSSGGVLSWTPGMTLSDSMVYFWRVSLDSVYNGKYNWRNSSFQYISGKRGWAQAHFDQFQNDNYQYLSYNKQDRDFQFVNEVNIVKVQTGVYPTIPWNDVWIKLNTGILRVWTCLNQWPNFIGVNFVVFDPVSGEPWTNYDQGGGYGMFNSCQCYPETYTFDYYTTDAQQQTKAWWFEQIENFIDSIPAGHYVAAYSFQNHNAENFTEDLYQAFEKIGAGVIRTITNDKPYAIFGVKGGSIGSANELVGINSNAVINMVDSFKTKWDEGYVMTPLIGPAGKWTSLHWDYKSLEQPSQDSVALRVIGVSSTGQEDVLIEGLTSDTLDLYNLDQRIDARDYPYIKLAAYMKDTNSMATQTPAQIEKLQVIYLGAPETALDPASHFYFYKDTIQEGDSVMLSIATHNISDYDMDSLLVKYWIVDHNRQTIPIATKRLAKHPIGDILIDTVKAPTTGLQGLNSIWIEVNPDDDQFEQYHSNNIGELYFYVKSDKINPILDVTFDGRHILDGDIVSAKPIIEIALNDENPFLIMDNPDDTAFFKLFIQEPGNITQKRIFFNKNGVDQLIFEPATKSNKTARITYQPELSNDGVYNLLIQATDKSNNKSGKIDFNVSFEVITESKITDVMNYPNPFSTNTKFVFTLTGSEVPTYFKIQILTITGKVIRELTLDDIGPIHIGKNITQYGWDGKDEFGDQVANGVYLYRVITDINGQEIEKFNTEKTSKFFTKEFGKMYLMR
jgi:hypothetical protein